MAVELEFINFIVPIELIKEKYPGGWEQCLEDYKHLIGGRVWFDDYLFRDGAMNHMDIESLIEKWQSLGFQIYDNDDNPGKWVDVCVVERLFEDTLPCDWIEVDGYAAYFKGKPKGEVIGREKFRA